MAAHRYEVMLARSVSEFPDASALPGGSRYEPKADGFRAVVHRIEDRVVIRSRTGTSLTGAFPDVAQAAQRLLEPGTLLDGELVAWRGGRLDFTALNERLTAGRRIEQIAQTDPAYLIVFDVLEHRGRDLRRLRLTDRRAILEDLAIDWEPPVQLTPYTDDPAVGADWLKSYQDADVGIEGLVIKGANQRYTPGRRGWLKLRIRNTTEAVAGALVGTLAEPRRLIVGLPGRNGALRVAGATLDLTTADRRHLADHIVAAGPEHPWPTELTKRHLGRFDAGTQTVVRIVPVVVEIDVDTAFEYGRWRHPVRLVRARADLTPDDLPGRRHN